MNMKNSQLKKGLQIALLLTLSNSVSAGSSCSENITKVVVHKNGNVYFSTDKTCHNKWCMIDFQNVDQSSKAYSMLLAAVTTDSPITFWWPNLATCNDQNQTYASPDYIDIRS